VVYDLDLKAVAQDEVYNLYTSSHSIRSTVYVLDLDHNIVQDVTSELIDGQVSINYDGDEATRSLELILYDPDFRAGFDVADMNHGVWFFDRMIQARIEMWLPGQQRWVEFPMFTGPVRGFKRTGPLVSLQCLGKDIFVRNSWASYKVAKGTNKVEAIRRVLQHAGETKFRFEGTTTATMPNDVNVTRALQASPFGWCRSVAAEINMRLFYNGAGEAVLRPKNAPGVVDWVIADGDSGAVLTYPNVDADYGRVVNVVRVESAQDPRINFTAMVDDNSDIHPSNMLRGGQPLYFGYEYQSDAVKTKAQAERAAKANLADRQRAIYNIKFDSLPLYQAEELDVAEIHIGGDRVIATLTQMSFGLMPDAPMAVGYQRLVSPALAKIRKF